MINDLKPILIPVGLAVAVFVIVILTAGVKPPKQALTCEQKSAEIWTVVSIANATGQLPGDPHIYTNPQLRVGALCE